MAVSRKVLHARGMMPDYRRGPIRASCHTRHPAVGRRSNSAWRGDPMTRTLATPIRLLRTVFNHDVLRLAALLAIAVFLIDWASKSWALRHLDGALVPFGSLMLGIERNEGFAFSSGAGLVPTWLVIGVRLAALALIIQLARNIAATSWRYACGFALLIGGGLGNAVDLVFRGGAVVDFIGVGPYTIDWAGTLVHLHFVFNAADVAVLLSLPLLGPVIRQYARAIERRLSFRRATEPRRA
jgi:lipoprotein signal peptidase